MTSNSGGRGSAALALLRDVADEVVVAVDSRASDSDVAAYSAVADRLYRLTFSYFERHLSWLHAQCSGDWIFRIDSDEVPSRALLEELPRLIQTRRVLQYWFSRKWLFPDGQHWLDEPPWYPDFQCRLVRNDGTLRFRGILHSSAEPLLPRRYEDLPLYHLDTVVNDVETRLAKITEYRDLRLGLVAPGGGSHDEVFYLPENTAVNPPADVLEEDQLLIDSVLQARVAPEHSVTTPAPVVSLKENDYFWVGKDQTDDDYKAEIRCLERDIKMYVGEARAIHFQVKNTGAQGWPWEPHDPAFPQVHVSYHWLSADTELIELDGLRSLIPEPLEPNQSCIVPTMVRGPAEPGAYLLELDLVWHRWFDCRTRCPVEVATEPVRRIR